MTKSKDFTPDNVKLNTCAAVALSILAGEDYDRALQQLPNGRYETIKKVMDSYNLEPIDGQNQKLSSFYMSHKRGKYFVCLEQGSSGHAIALIDGIAYNMQGFTDTAKVNRYYDFSRISKTTNDTAYTDEDNSSTDITKNKYVLYAHQQLVNKLAPKLSKQRNIKTSVQSRSSSGFTININGKKVDFTFTTNCTDKDVMREIDKTIKKVV